MKESKQGKLILLRHGASVWNDANLFTGWVDIPLSKKGIDESLAVGEKLKNTPIDRIFVSALSRALETALLALSLHEGGKVPLVLHPEDPKWGIWRQIYRKETEESCIPVIASEALNERMYGKLQGLNKQATKEKYGEEQVQLWRRSYDIAPPEGESLKMTAQRSISYFETDILPFIQAGESVLVCAHGNSLRGIRMILDNLSPEQVVSLEIATGELKFYEWRDGALHATG